MRVRRVALVLAMVITVLPFLAGTAQAAPVVAEGFTKEEVYVNTGITNPPAIRFGPDGRVWIAEKIGRISTFDSVDDKTPEVIVDIRDEVNSQAERGLTSVAKKEQNAGLVRKDWTPKPAWSEFKRVMRLQV